MNLDATNEKLERALSRLEKALDTKVATIEAENTRLRAEIIKLKQELKIMTAQQSLSPENNVTSLEEAAKKATRATPKKQPAQEEDGQSGVQLSLNQLKKMVS